MVEKYSAPEKCDECADISEKQLLIDRFYWLYNEFKKFQDYEYEDESWNLIKLSCDDGWQTKRWSMKTISVEVKETGESFNNLNKFESFGNDSIFLWPLRNFMANEAVQKERQKYTVEWDRSKVKRVKYSLNINERVDVDWIPFVSFHGDTHYLDASNHPHEIYSIELDEVKDVLNYYNDIINVAKGHNMNVFKVFTQKKAEKDQKDADRLLKESGLLW